MKYNLLSKASVSISSLGLWALVTGASNVHSAPGNLSDIPLYLSRSVEPNIMLLLDSSGSMRRVELSPLEYDETATYASCSNPIQYRYENPNNPGAMDRSIIEFKVKLSGLNTGEVQFTIGDGIWRTWNPQNNCFDNSTIYYRAWLYADVEINENGSNYYITGEDNYYRARDVSGHFLNWYFSQKNEFGLYQAAKFLDEDGNPRSSKVNIRRADIMKQAASDLVSGLSDARVGLMQFRGSDGARAFMGLSSLTESNRSELLDKIAAVTSSTSTPLAEAFSGVGRYFITGYEDQPLTYIGSDGNQVSAPGREIFNREPQWNYLSPAVQKPNNTIEGSAIQYYCQKNFMIAVTDGAPENDDDISHHLKGYDYACEGNPAGCTNESQGYNLKDGVKYHEMDDVIKALYDIDLRPDLTRPDGSPVKNNIVSYIVGFAEDNISDIPMMINAGHLGRGGLYDARDAAGLKLSFNQIANRIYETVGSSSSLAFNSTSLDAGTAVFAARFHSGEWTGDLSAITIEANGDISESPSWEAASLLDTVNPNDRVMLTHRRGTGGVPFTATGVNLSSSESRHRQDLSINTSSGEPVTDTRAEDRLNYLRGEAVNEGSTSDDFRKRASRLGDIVNSTPVYVGPPKAPWPDKPPFPTGSNSYSAFKNQNSSRTPMIYVGANDGFLHGFNAATTGLDGGKELIAYSPEALLSTRDEYGLHALTAQHYQHKYYVDGTPTATDVYINGSWKTVLVGGLSAGGKGYYALDVTDPDSFSESNASNIVLWEFTSIDNENLGYSFSRPQIGLMSNGKWAAIFGNGYNSDTGDAGLFIVYLDGPDDTGNNYVYISTREGSPTNKNGLSTPSIVDSDQDGVIDRIYAGDLRGNMWVFDVSDPDNWAIAHGNPGNRQPLFKAGINEPITAAPLVLRNHENGNGSEPNLLVTFGTGQYLTRADSESNAAGGFYAVSDSGNHGLSKANLSIRSISTAYVAQQDGTTVGYRRLDGDDINWETDSGWYVQLSRGNTPDGQDAGERVVSRPDLLRDVLFFNTLIPTRQACSAGGYGWLMSIDVKTGLAPAGFAVFDTNGDGRIDSADQGFVGQMIAEGIPNKSGFLDGKKQYTPTSADTIVARDINVGKSEREGRLAWEEMTSF